MIIILTPPAPTAAAAAPALGAHQVLQIRQRMREAGVERSVDEIEALMKRRPLQKLVDGIAR